MNSQPSDAIIIEQLLNAPVGKVWEAITELRHMKSWYMNALTDFRAEAGFETRFTVHHEGKEFIHLWKVTEVIPRKRISYEWKYAGYPGNSLVIFELSALDRRTKVKLTHTGLESFLPDRHPELGRGNFLAGWTALIGTSIGQFLEARTNG